tara:strand:- start:12054 stop:12320 length:267 start_codon:yes stop_codon:yes gene_type:complete
VLLDPVEEKTEGGIELPAGYIERQQMATTYATFVEAGDGAFSEWAKGPRPRPGDRVVVDKYCGVSLRAGKLEDRHRLIQDDEILAIIN